MNRRDLRTTAGKERVSLLFLRDIIILQTSSLVTGARKNELDIGCGRYCECASLLTKGRDSATVFPTEEKYSLKAFAISSSEQYFTSLNIIYSSLDLETLPLLRILFISVQTNFVFFLNRLNF